MGYKTISEMIRHLEYIKNKYGDLPLVYSRDDEGNGFYPVYYTPSIGKYDESGKEWEDCLINDKPTHVCIN